MQRLKKLIGFVSAAAIAAGCLVTTPITHAVEKADFDMGERLSDYNVIFDSKGSSAKDSMPIGNGDIGANVWVEDNGDLVMYLAKGDTFSEATRLLKLGKVRIKLTPNPFAAGKPFKQELSLIDGTVYITAGEGAYISSQPRQTQV